MVENFSRQEGESIIDYAKRNAESNTNPSKKVVKVGDVGLDSAYNYDGRTWYAIDPYEFADESLDIEEEYGGGILYMCEEFPDFVIRDSNDGIVATYTDDKRVVSTLGKYDTLEDDVKNVTDVAPKIQGARERALGRTASMATLPNMKRYRRMLASPMPTLMTGMENRGMRPNDMPASTPHRMPVSVFPFISSLLTIHSP